MECKKNELLCSNEAIFGVAIFNDMDQKLLKDFCLCKSGCVTHWETDNCKYVHTFAPWDKKAAGQRTEWGHKRSSKNRI